MINSQVSVSIFPTRSFPPSVVGLVLNDDDLPADSIHCGSSWRHVEILGHVTGTQWGQGEARGLHQDSVGCWLGSFGCCPYKPVRKNKCSLYFTRKEKPLVQERQKKLDDDSSFKSTAPVKLHQTVLINASASPDFKHKLRSGK